MRDRADVRASIERAPGRQQIAGAGCRNQVDGPAVPERNRFRLRRALLKDDAHRATRTVASVVRAAREDIAAALARGNVVGAGGRKRPVVASAEGGGQRHRAETRHRHPRREIACRPDEPDRQAVAANGDAGNVSRLAGEEGSAPTMSATDGSRPLSLGVVAICRSIVCRNVCAVTSLSEGGEKRKPDRMRNVYVRPSGERVGIAAATSGLSRAPSGPAESG